MKTRRKWFRIIVIVFAIVSSIVLLFLNVAAPIQLGLGGALRANKLREKLLCETDHQALLKAGREILNQVPPIENKTKDGQRTSGYLPFPREVKEMGLPQTILKLKPHGVTINHDNYEIYLTIQMHGGMDHFGVRIYPEDYKPPRHNFRGGNRELIPGLCYYDDGYSHPEYGKRIDALIEKYKDK